MSRQGIQKDKTYSNITKFWDCEAEELGEDPTVTIRDYCFRMHELQQLINEIGKAQSLLDVGCGTGMGTAILSTTADKTMGFDYSKEMIRWANQIGTDENFLINYLKRYQEFPINKLIEALDSSRIMFCVSSILDIPDSLNRQFDVLTGQRILINLVNHEDQIAAIKQLRKVSRVGARLYFVESSIQGHQYTDKYRSDFGLSKLEKYWHNTYIDESRFEDWTSAGWKINTLKSFDTYMLLSKVLYPAAIGEENCKFVSGANIAAARIANLYRTYDSAMEIGEEALLRQYVKMVSSIDQRLGSAINDYLEKISFCLPNWRGLGHQKLICAEAL